MHVYAIRHADAVNHGFVSELVRFAVYKALLESAAASVHRRGWGTAL